MDRKETMEALFDATAASLLERIQSGVATPSDLNVARQMLRDNNITAVPRNQPLADLAKELDPAELDDAPPALKFA